MDTGKAEALRKEITNNNKAIFPLSFAQQRLWFLDQLSPNIPIYNISVAVCLKGTLDIPALIQSLNQIVQRHDILRTTFVSFDGQPWQTVMPSIALTLPIKDLQDIPQSLLDTTLQSLLMQEAHHQFDLTQGPLIRTQLFQLHPGEYIFLLTVHHIVFDGWSVSIFFDELSTFYKANITKEFKEFSSLPKQYIDYVTWQRSWLQDDNLENLLVYWKQQLENMPSLLQLPTDRPRPIIQRFCGARQHFCLSPTFTQALMQLCHQERVTLFMLLFAAFRVLLYRYTDQQDIPVGVPIAGRMQGDVENLIGFFVNTLVLRTKVSGNVSFRSLLESVRLNALEAYIHQDLPFERLVEEMKEKRDLNHNPLFQVLFVLQNTPPKNTLLPGIELSFLEIERTTTKFDLSLEMQETNDGLVGSFEYSTDLFDASTIARMSEHFQVLLAGIIAHPEERLDKLPLLTDAERHKLLIEWNTTYTTYPRDRCIHQLFEDEALRMPASLALVYENESLTYGQLNQQANQLAHYLQSIGVGPETLIGICMERSLHMIVGLIAILKAGGAYVPLDPTYPQERLKFMIRDTEITTLLTQKHFRDTLFYDTEVTIICLDEQKELIMQQQKSNPQSNITPENLAYVMYTSGSTGTPKGVCITHRNVVRLVKNTNYIELSEKEVFLQFAPISFDASTFEIWGSLLNGAQLVIFPAYTPSLEEFGATLERYHITTLWLTAGLFHQIVESQLDKIKHIKQVISGGDVLSASHVRQALDAGCRIINGYGPTENTTFACCYGVTLLDASKSSVPIGSPISNTQVYILDAYLQPVPIGIPGELYIGGDGLARGYLRRPELTAERFIINPFDRKFATRLYKTGDLACYRSDGTIEFLGRNDTQIKIRGFRIEPREIEMVLSQHPAVQETLVVAIEGHLGEKILVAYTTLSQGKHINNDDLRSYVRSKLPEHMVPSIIMIIAAFPLTPNGKVDRNALPPPTLINLDKTDLYIAPRSTLELQIVQIFETVLQLHPVSVNDDFFLLGGHSLSAMRAMSRLQKLFGSMISLSTFFQLPTAEQLAAYLNRMKRPVFYSPLVKVQLHDSKPPLFCIHHANGDIYCYIRLARYLGKDQPLYAFEESPLVENWEPCISVRDMAKKYIEILRVHQPRGPYFLGGYSFGGYVAFEMASMLYAQGQTIALLALLDTDAPIASQKGLPNEEEDDASIITWFAEGLAKRWPHRSKEYLPRLLSEQELHQLNSDDQWSYLLDVAKTVNYVSEEDGLVLLRRQFQIYRNHILATQNYQPQGVYPGRITLFQAEQIPQGVPWKPGYTLGWQKYSSEPVEFHTVPGNHYNLFDEPYIQRVAECLKRCLNNASS